MLRSMYTAISGLKNHQTLLDVTANNIANVNTYGFKAERVAFKDILSQTIQSASSPTANIGGMNNMQVGLGITVDSIQQLHTQGALQNTGVATDLAIQGDGFFRVTADGSTLAADPNLAATGDGNSMADATPDPQISYTRAGNFTFDSNGDLVTSDGYYVVGLENDPTLNGGLGAPDPAQLQIKLHIDPATTRSVSIDPTGRVSAVDSTGNITTVGWVSMAKFANPSGLTLVGNNKYEQSNNSGAPVIGTAKDATGMGAVTAGALEMSNVDLAEEFTEMIRAQRGFQANARTITTSDQILEELVNLKR